MQVVTITRAILSRFIQDCNKNPNKETCSMITWDTDLGLMNYFNIKNISEENPEVHFEMDPTELYQVLSRTDLMRPGSPEKLYMTAHSHPTGLPVPSVTDYKRLHYDVYHMIYGMWYNWMEDEDKAKYKPVRVWKYNFEKQFFDEVELKVID